VVSDYWVYHRECLLLIADLLIVLLKQFTDHINCNVILVRGFPIIGFRSEVVVVLCFQIRGFEKSTGGLLVAVGLVFGFFFIEIHWCPEVARLAAQLFPDPIEGTGEKKKVKPISLARPQTYSMVERARPFSLAPRSPGRGPAHRRTACQPPRSPGSRSPARSLEDLFVIRWSWPDPIATEYRKKKRRSPGIDPARVL
jgi:hypothetical protein